MRIFKINTDEGTFITNRLDTAEKAVSRDDLISITRTEMTKEEYMSIPATCESAEFFKQKTNAQ